MITADIDLERLLQDRMRMTSFNDSATDCRERVQAIRRIPFEFRAPEEAVPLRRKIARFPYVPSNPRERDERCYEAYNIQVHGLLKRLSSTGTKQVVIGVSGGLDSTHALITRWQIQAWYSQDVFPRQSHAVHVFSATINACVESKPPTRDYNLLGAGAREALEQAVY